MNFRSWQRWQLIEYALLQKISEEKAVENGKALPQTKQELSKCFYDIFTIPTSSPFFWMVMVLIVVSKSMRI
nr:MAG TPA: hypothetical protein [Caudoviricetes sp.]